jgi:hypothetical protein
MYTARGCATCNVGLEQGRPLQGWVDPGWGGEAGELLGSPQHV